MNSSREWQDIGAGPVAESRVLRLDPGVAVLEVHRGLMDEGQSLAAFAGELGDWLNGGPEPDWMVGAFRIGPDRLRTCLGSLVVARPAPETRDGAQCTYLINCIFDRCRPNL